MRVQHFRNSWVAAAILAIIATGADGQTPPKPAKPAAVINGEAIPQSDLQALLDARPSPVPLSAEQQKQLRQAAIDMLIDDALMRQFLRKEVQPVAAAEIAKEIDLLKDALKKQKKTVEEYLRESKQTEEQLRLDVVARLQWKAYITAKYPESQLKEYYDANKVFFDKVFVKASHILVKVGGNATPAEKQAAKNKLETLRQDLVAGKIKFADAAKKYSDCPTKEKGGDIGPFPYKFVVVEPFAKAAFATKVGEMTNVIVTDFGFHLILVTERTTGEASDFPSLRDTVREVIAQETELYQRILAEQRKSAKIDVNVQ